MASRSWSRPDKRHIVVYGRGDKVPEGDAKHIKINATSKSADEWSRGLSPFFLGPVRVVLDDDHAYDVVCFENAWQYSKVYACHTDGNGDPTEEYFEWAEAGFANPSPVRFPMGKGAIPEYSLHRGEKLGYVEARIRIYCPLYAAAVVETDAFDRLAGMYADALEADQTLLIFDFDGHNSLPALNDYSQIIYNTRRKLGHAFVLAMLLQNVRVWEDGYDPSLVHQTPIPRRKLRK